MHMYRLPFNANIQAAEGLSQCYLQATTALSKFDTSLCRNFSLHELIIDALLLWYYYTVNSYLAQYSQKL